jgi:hypothetical protein
MALIMMDWAGISLKSISWRSNEAYSGKAKLRTFVGKLHL